MSGPVLERALDDALRRGLVSCEQLPRRLENAGRLAWSRDQTRNAVIAAMGWRVLPVTWADLVDTPDQLIATVRRARAA